MRAYATDAKKSFLTSVAPQGFFLTGHHRGGTHSLDMQVTTRDTAFPLRFKNPANRDALRHVAELTGMSMKDIAERAIEHQVVLLAVDLDAGHSSCA